MLGYYLNLLNNKIGRFYFIIYAFITLINVFIFELLYFAIFNSFSLYLIIFLSVVFFIFSTLVYNLKEQYLLNYLHVANAKKVLSHLKKINPKDISGWEPNELFTLINSGNYTIDNLIFLIENSLHFIFKTVFMLSVLIINKHNLINLMVITTFLILINLYLTINQKSNDLIIKMDYLHNYYYYLIHERINYLINYFNKQLNTIILSVGVKNNNSFIYLNIILICLYYQIISYRLQFEDKLFIVMYVRNSSYIFTLFQNMINNYDQVTTNCKSIDKLFKLNTIDKKVKKINIINLDKIIVHELEFIGVKLENELEIKNNDKIILFGDSGCGKTTLMKIIKGIDKADILKMSILSDLKMNKFNDFEEIKLYVLYVKYDSFPYFAETIKDFICDDYQVDIILIKLLIEICDMNVICSDINLNVNNLMISSGQMRRLVLIKTFYQFYQGKYLVLLLDEIDNGIQQDLFKNILSSLFESNYYSNKIIILISHNKLLQDSNDFFSKKICIKNKILKII